MEFATAKEWLAAHPPPDSAFEQTLALVAPAEHLAAPNELERPPWATEPHRFLDRFWFVSDVPGFRALAIAQWPAAFRRRGIFIAEGALQRV